MKVIQKSYVGDFPRPTPEVEVVEKDQLVIISTPWGQQASSEAAHGMLKDYFEAAASDPEVTSPFPKLPQLTPLANNLRIATKLANNQILMSLNKEVYTSACELLALSFSGKELCWIQVGQPFLLLLRDGDLSPLSVTTDLGLDYSNPTPLPSRLVGTDRHIELQTKSLLLQEGDTLIAFARSSIPKSCLLFNGKQLSTEAVVEKLHELAIDSNPDLPFWIGAIQIP